MERRVNLSNRDSIISHIINIQISLVKIENMPKGGYAYIADSLSLISRNTKIKYSFGDRVVVKVISLQKSIPPT